MIDVYSRRIVGYAIGKTLCPELTTTALKIAIATRKTDNLIHHSDQGIQYTCKDYIKIPKDNGIRISMLVCLSKAILMIMLLLNHSLKP